MHIKCLMDSDYKKHDNVADELNFNLKNEYNVVFRILDDFFIFNKRQKYLLTSCLSGDWYCFGDFKFQTFLSKYKTQENKYVYLLTCFLNTPQVLFLYLIRLLSSLIIFVFCITFFVMLFILLICGIENHPWLWRYIRIPMVWYFNEILIKLVNNIILLLTIVHNFITSSLINYTPLHFTKLLLSCSIGQIFTLFLITFIFIKASINLIVLTFFVSFFFKKPFKDKTVSLRELLFMIIIFIIIPIYFFWKPLFNIISVYLLNTTKKTILIKIFLLLIRVKNIYWTGLLKIWRYVLIRFGLPEDLCLILYSFYQITPLRYRLIIDIFFDKSIFYKYERINKNIIDFFHIKMELDKLEKQKIEIQKHNIFILKVVGVSALVVLSIAGFCWWAYWDYRYWHPYEGRDIVIRDQNGDVVWAVLNGRQVDVGLDLRHHRVVPVIMY